MTYINKVRPRQAMIFVVSWIVYLMAAGRAGNCQNLSINSLNGNQKDVVTFTVSAKNTPNSVQSFGFDVHFDPKVFEFSRYERGKMVEKYKFFDCAQLEPGVVRCGGFTAGTDKISAGQSGEMACLYFKKINCQNSSLSLEKLVDDFKGWETGEGRFLCWRN
jgi:hypothetical protein